MGTFSWLEDLGLSWAPFKLEDLGLSWAAVKLVLNFVELLQEGFQIKRSSVTFYLNSFLWNLLEASFELRGAFTKRISNRTWPGYVLFKFLFVEIH